MLSGEAIARRDALIEKLAARAVNAAHLLPVRPWTWKSVPFGFSGGVLFISILTSQQEMRAMRSLPQRIMEYAESLPEATPLCPAGLLHLGKRAVVGQALSRLVRSGKLMRICYGVYMRPVETRFGQCAPSIGRALQALSALWRETFVPCGGSAANRLGLTTQNPIREIYLTSGRDRQLHFGGITIELRHAPRWQLVAPHRKAGDVIRALAWLGPKEVDESLKAVLPKLCAEELAELSAARAIMPVWMAEPLSAHIALQGLAGHQPILRDVDITYDIMAICGTAAISMTTGVDGLQLVRHIR